jgi:hypothetical protein
LQGLSALRSVAAAAMLKPAALETLNHPSEDDIGVAAALQMLRLKPEL